MTSSYVTAVLCGFALVVACYARVTKNENRGANALQTNGFVRTPRDCQDHWDNGERVAGVFTIFPNGTYPVKVLCQHNETATSTVIQRRYNGKENFNRPWNDYKMGFGSPQADYWIGLDTIHHLTWQGGNSLQLHLQEWGGSSAVMTYSDFQVSDESTRYRVYVSGAYGALSDDLGYNNGMVFSTYDRPDAYNCAINQNAGWWFNYCTYTSPNGKYYRGRYRLNPRGFYDGIYYKDWLGYDYSMQHTAMVLVRK
nr:fibrinogen domain-containing type 1 protein 1 [Arenicola marina]